jgi:hypothetical protein
LAARASFFDSTLRRSRDYRRAASLVCGFVDLTQQSTVLPFGAEDQAGDKGSRRKHKHFHGSAPNVPVINTSLTHARDTSSAVRYPLS